jgi:hypothetical protein
MLKSTVLRRTLGPEREGVTGGWRKLHSEELHNLYPSPIIVKMIDGMVGACNTHGRDEKYIHFGWKAWRKETTQKT